MRVRPIQKSIIPVLVCLAVAGCFKSSEERAAAHLQSGIELAAEGDYDRAFVEFRNTLKFDEDNLSARREMAKIHMTRGAKLQAYRNYLAVSEAEPNDVELRVILSELAFDLGSWDEFTRHATKTSEMTEGTTPDDATLVPRIAALDLASQYRVASLEDDRPLKDTLLAQAETQDQAVPGNAVLRKILIDGYVLQGRYDQALSQVEKAIAAVPDDINNYNSKLELLVRMEREDEIEAQLRETIKIFPGDVNSKKTLLRYLMSRGETTRAEEFLREVVAGSDEGDKRKTAYGDLVAFILQTRGPEAALTEIDAILVDNPSDTFRVLRASILFETGNRDDAVTTLEALVTADDETTTLTPLELQEAKTLLARMLLIDGNEVGARTLVEQVLETDPTAVGALKMRANWLIEADDTDGAIIALRTAMENAPDDADAVTLMAQAYQRAGNTDLMLEFLSLATETTDNAPEESSRYAAALVAQDKLLQAETVLIASLRISPGNVAVLNQLGRLYVQLDDIPRARQVVGTLRNIDQDDARANADAIELELVAREQGADEALQYLETLATREGDTAEQAKLAIIRARIANGEGDSALSYAQGLLDEEPDNLNYRYAFALANAALGNYPEAVSLMQALLADHPQTTQAWLQLSRIQLAAGDTDAALATVDQGLEALPNSGDLQWAKASFLQRAGDVDGAIDIFETLYTQNSASLVVANNLASMLTTYRTDDAESLTRATVIARRLAGTDIPALQDTYGWIQHLNGNHDEAIEYLESAAAALGRDVVVQVHLGMAYAAAGRRNDAIAQLRRALEVGGPLGGNEEVLDGARAKIAELEAAPAVDDGQN